MCVSGPLSFIKQLEQSIKNFTASLPLQEVISKKRWTALTRAILWNTAEQRIDEWARTVWPFIHTEDCVRVTLRKRCHMTYYWSDYLNICINGTVSCISKSAFLSSSICLKGTLRWGQHQLRVNMQSFSLVFLLSLINDCIRLYKHTCGPRGCSGHSGRPQPANQFETLPERMEVFFCNLSRTYLRTKTAFVGAESDSVKRTVVISYWRWLPTVLQSGSSASA